MPSIKDSIGTKLRQVLDTESVYPNFIPRTEANEWVSVPAVVYRQLSGDRTEYGDIGASDYSNDSFLIEIFSYSIEECETWRNKIENAFRGPVGGDDSQPGLSVQWLHDGPTIYRACAKTPSSDADFPAYDAHEVLNFEQLVLDITYLRSC